MYLHKSPKKGERILMPLLTNSFCQFLGDSITIADFPMYVSLDYHIALDKECLKKFPILDNYIKNINSEPKIKAFFKSEKYFKNLCPPHQPVGKLINK